MRIRDSEQRTRRWEALKEVTGERTVAGAIDVAVAYYLVMHGDTVVEPSGAVPELMDRATEKGSLTAREIAEVLDVDELPVEYSEEWHRGRDG